MPIEVDDEFITSSQIFPQPIGLTSITAGYNANCFVYWCSMFPANPAPAMHDTAWGFEQKRQDLKARMDSVKYCLDDYLPRLSHWSSSDGDQSSARLASQWGSMRANYLISQLWLESAIFEQLITLDGSASIHASQLHQLSTDETVWDVKEDICRRLLRTLYSFSRDTFEPNGNYSVSVKSSSIHYNQVGLRRDGDRCFSP